jgi:hypothetical protein
MEIIYQYRGDKVHRQWIEILIIIVDIIIVIKIMDISQLLHHRINSSNSKWEWVFKLEVKILELILILLMSINLVIVNKA